jgi:hypothetical protein
MLSRLMSGASTTLCSTSHRLPRDFLPLPSACIAGATGQAQGKLALRLILSSSSRSFTWSAVGSVACLINFLTTDCCCYLNTKTTDYWRAVIPFKLDANSPACSPQAARCRCASPVGACSSAAHDTWGASQVLTASHMRACLLPHKCPPWPTPGREGTRKENI